MIIARYITKEILYNFIAITSILLLIALSNRFVIYLAKAATGELPVSFVFTIVGFFIPELLSILIPLSFFLALLFTFGRLYADSEMYVLQSSGLGFKFIITLTLSVALLVTVLNAWLTLSVAPALSEKREILQKEGEYLGIFQTLVPGRFQTLMDGQLVFYLEDLNTNDQHLKKVFIAETPTEESPHKEGLAFMVAKEAHLEHMSDAKNYYLVLNKGYRYQGLLGQADYTVVQFDEYGRQTPQKNDTPVPDTLKMKGSSTLWKSTLPTDKAELQWRFSIPLSIPLLALLALGLSKVRPRQGRFAKFLPALTIYIVYYNLFTVAKRSIANGQLSEYIGVWWVHGIVFMLGLILIAKESGFWQAKRYAYNR